MHNSSSIRAVIFDMDGLLVDSEPYWRVAETNVFGRLSVAPNEEEFEAMMGNRIQEVITKWHNKYPWDNFDLTATQNEIINEVATLVTQNSNLLPGVQRTLEFFNEKNVPMVVASSSPLMLIKKLLSHYSVIDNFKGLYSAEFEMRGKPAPDVFLTASKELGVEPQLCLVFEDSYNGVVAAKAANMKCVAVPSPEYLHQDRFEIADLKLPSLKEWGTEHWEYLSSL